MRPVLTESGQKKIEELLREQGFSELAMMENVASAIAVQLAKYLKSHSKIRNLVVLVGPGNNGADGLAVLRLLETQHKDSLAQIESLTLAYGAELKSESARVQEKLLELQNRPHVKKIELGQLKEKLGLLSGHFLFIDALFGVGFQKRESKNTDPFKWIRDLQLKGRASVASVDVPSGLTDHGESDKSFASLQADRSFSVCGPKISQLESDGADRSGSLHCVDLAVSADNQKLLSCLSRDEAPFLWVSKSRKELRAFMESQGAHFRKLKRSAHKNMRGRVLIVGGSLKSGGAMQLVAEAALKLGAGYATIVESTLENRNSKSFLNPFPEAVIKSWPSSVKEWSAHFKEHDVLVFGPGLPAGGLNPEDLQWNFFKTALIEALTSEKKSLGAVVVDGGGLATLASWLRPLVGNPEQAILCPTMWTPHPKEARDILKALNPESSLSSETSRIGLFAELKKNLSPLARGFLLKGAYPILCEPMQADRPYVFNVASSKLATAGSGDVLSGAIAGLFLSIEAPVDRRLFWAAFVAQFLQARCPRKLASSVLASEISTALRDEFDTL